MGDIKSKIGQAGLILAAMGAISILLSLFNYNIRLLKWIDLWGDIAGWLIRIGLIIVGIILFLAFKQTETE